MNFLKSMMVGNRQDSDNVNVEEVAALIDDAKQEDGPQAEAFNKLALIQSRIKGTQSDAGNLEAEDTEDAANTEQISDFADVVRGIKENSVADDASLDPSGASPNDEDEAVLAPVMTEEDFSNLDDELARMSDELEAAENEGEPDIPATSEPTDGTAMPPVSAVTTQISESRTEETAKALETAKDAATGDAPRASSMLISEKQGGASMPMAKPEPVQPAAPAEDGPNAVVADEVATPPPIVAVPAPAAGRSGRRAGRVKTRLLGFEHATGKNTDPFSGGKEPATGNQMEFPVGWVIVVDGPGYGTAFALFNGVSQIGRGEGQAIKLDFGDNSISRENHAAVAYDIEKKRFFLGHGGKANLVRLNDNPVLSTEEIKNADVVRIGETTLRLIALCGEDFNWDAKGKEDQSDAAIA